MKKTIITMLFMAASISAFAQLKVDNYGMVSVGEATNAGDGGSGALVTIGDDQNYYWGDFTIYNMGVISSKVPNTINESVGLYSEVYPAVNGTQTQPISTAIWGVACGSSTSNFGVAGSLNGSYGAAIYGTKDWGSGPQLYGKYAGYFNGNTHVNGNLTTTSVYNLSDMRLSQNVTLLSETANSKGNAIDQLQKLSVLEYNLISPTPKKERSCQPDHFKGDEEESDEVELIRRHYGLSAQELQNVYPDLVLEGQDGYFGINYVELVPILIRSIQELKQELDEVRGGNGDVNMSRGAATAVASDYATGNVLYQNTPNPFKEQTVIRFSLADNAANAAICIFDMSGKMLKKLPISSGETSVSINGWELGEGMFLYTLIVNGREIDTKRMIIAK